MITRLDLQHFKCFEILKLPLGPLTLLSGANASGKSSVLQALALLHQTLRGHEWSIRLMLNGPTLELGTVLDVIDEVHGRREFELGMVYGDETYDWRFSGDRKEMSMAVERVVIGDTPYEQPALLRHLLPYTPGLAPDETGSTASLLARCLLRLTYLTAERIGPREIYPLEDPQTTTVVGPRGEHAASLLHWGRDEPVVDGLAIEGVAKTRLHQARAWMRLFFPGCALEVQQIPQTNAVTLGLRTSDDTNFHRPVHAGFGLTQVLPIVIAAVSADKGDILLIENPEVHLHPAGQAFMGQFLVDVARAGIQVIVETHSDHVLNGIRRWVKAGRIAPEQVALHFFRARSEDGAQVTSPQLNRSGSLDAWPEGFFDQFDKDVNYLAGWGE
uniref:Predicted ATPase n=1 Tax=Candidatus Kentrum sp. FM TaxID=2126340 RepID=A0A450RWI4_9GAMM|nr:MAG: Predicted ATPase [Candidatus Kentron sp. FM]VFJ43546.1 MAG: Predicted ATPase [Candidatus Kentron sp. FM]VFK05590.1 MAG: Predicted ATPase [Candidatus Kentron sp. FM]